MQDSTAMHPCSTHKARGTSDKTSSCSQMHKGGKRRRSACLRQAFGRPCALYFAAEPRGDGGVASARSQLTSIDSAWVTCDAQNQSVGRNLPPSGGLARTAEGLWSSPGRNPRVGLARLFTSDLQLISGQAVSTYRTHRMVRISPPLVLRSSSRSRIT